jgi:phosphoribosylglycinamide formyltransferase-1
MTNIAILASGSGSNAQRIMEYFQDSKDIKVSILMSNNKNAFALERAKSFGVPTLIFDKNTFCNTDLIVERLKSENISWVILAGFLWLIPDNLVKAFPNKIINIHPALLPKYGGKGMYGHFVHEAVVAAKDTVSGISIHYVNENYDEGQIIFQAKCDICPEDTAEVVAKKVLTLEHLHFPVVLENLINKSLKNN